MLQVPRAVLASFEDCLVANNISVNILGHYLKWLRFYLDFCSKYRHDANNSESIIAFEKKLLEKGQSERQQQQAAHAIRLFLNVNQANTVSRSPSILPVSTVNNAENANTGESLISSTTNKSLWTLLLPSLPYLEAL